MKLATNLKTSQGRKKNSYYRYLFLITGLKDVFSQIYIAFTTTDRAVGGEISHD